jgi:hypothetical protein
MNPLQGLLVVDLSQFLSGPSAALRLADLGARVIKVERSGSGDICRSLYLTDTDVGGDSTLFHAINRSKESLALDLKVPEDLAALRRLLERADVLIQNFRPGVIERLGLGWDAVHALNPAWCTPAYPATARAVRGPPCRGRTCWRSRCPASPGSMATRGTARCPWACRWRTCSPATS